LLGKRRYLKSIMLKESMELTKTSETGMATRGFTNSAHKYHNIALEISTAGY
jgi:hypothetical protein